MPWLHPPRCSTQLKRGKSCVPSWCAEKDQSPSWSSRAWRQDGGKHTGGQPPQPFWALRPAQSKALLVHNNSSSDPAHLQTAARPACGAVLAAFPTTVPPQGHRHPQGPPAWPAHQWWHPWSGSGRGLAISLLHGLSCPSPFFDI